MICAGCQRTLEVGDQYIEATAGEFMGEDIGAGMNDLMAELLGGSKGGKLIYCEDCTQTGGDFMFSTFYGDDDDE